MNRALHFMQFLGQCVHFGDEVFTVGLGRFEFQVFLLLYVDLRVLTWLQVHRVGLRRWYIVVSCKWCSACPVLPVMIEGGPPLSPVR